MEKLPPIQINNSQVIIVVVPDSPAELFNGTFTGIPLINTPNGLVPYQREQLAIEAPPLALPAGEVIEEAEVVEEKPEPPPLRIIREPLRKPTYSYVEAPIERTRWDSSDYIAMSLVGGMAAVGLGIVGILAYALYPLIAMALTVGVKTIGAVLMLGGVLYWATQLMGFWDHTKPFGAQVV
jgi:hypothetical protein